MENKCWNFDLQEKRLRQVSKGLRWFPMRRSRNNEEHYIFVHKKTIQDQCKHFGTET